LIPFPIRTTLVPTGFRSPTDDCAQNAPCLSPTISLPKLKFSEEDETAAGMAHTSRLRYQRCHQTSVRNNNPDILPSRNSLPVFRNDVHARSCVAEGYVLKPASVFHKKRAQTPDPLRRPPVVLNGHMRDRFLLRQPS